MNRSEILALMTATIYASPCNLVLKQRVKYSIAVAQSILEEVEKKTGKFSYNSIDELADIIPDEEANYDT